MGEPFTKGVDSITQAEHISPEKTGDNIEAKRVASYGWNPNTMEWERAQSDSSKTYKVNDIDDTTATEYYGKTNANGDYLIQRVTSSVISYATVLNNDGVTDYATAWSTRASLTYGRYDEAF